MSESSTNSTEYDAVNPRHYEHGGPVIEIDIGAQITKGRKWISHTIRCIEVFRHIADPRLATAFKYIWRVAFGGKAEPWDSRTQPERDERDIKSAIWYLQDWVDNPIQRGVLVEGVVKSTPANNVDLQGLWGLFLAQMGIPVARNEGIQSDSTNGPER